MKVFLDDMRNPPDESWHICRTYLEALTLVIEGKVTTISFDHDLGSILTGYDLAVVIERLVYIGHIKLPNYLIHSSNPVGRENIRRAMESAKRFSKGELI